MYQKRIETNIAVYRFYELDAADQALLNKAKEQVAKSYVPYSHFHVGAAVRLANGEVLAGSNQENAAYPSGLCAERVTLFYANAQHPEVPVRALAIAGWTNGHFLEQPITPCGACRQVLLETETRYGQDIRVLLYGAECVYVLERASDLLPLCFVRDSMNG